MTEQTNLVPKRRFKGFQDTDAWEQRELGKLCSTFADGDWIEAKDQSNEGIRLLQTGNVGVNQFIDKPDKAKWISEETFARLKCTEVYPNDILISRLPEPAGRACIVPNIGQKMITAVDCTIVRTNSNCNSKYLVQYLSSGDYFSEVNEFLAGGTRQRISRSNLANFIVPIPASSVEQEQIGTVLGQLDNLITLHQRKLNKTKALKSAYLSEMFPAEGECEPKRRFPGFTGAWEQRKYGEVIDLLSGQDLSPSEYNDTCNGIPYMTGASCIVGKETIVNRWTTVPRCLAEKGDVLLVCKGSGYGAIAVLAQDKAHIARQFMALKNLPNLDKVFNFYLLNSVIENIKKDARGLIAGIARDAVIKQEISIPLLEEQSQIGTFFKQIDHLITLHQRKLEKLQNLKKAYLNEMFV